MRPINDKLAGEMLEAGKREFLEKGYEKASLRGIAASLGVTTGAIYRYYQDKEALFQAIVEEPAKELLAQFRKMQRDFSIQPLQKQLEGINTASSEGQDWMFHYIYDHFDAFKLITCCANGTSYEHYIDQLIDIEVNSSFSLTDQMEEGGMKVHRLDEELIHILVSGMFTGMFETVRHDMPREKAQIYIQDLCAFYQAGWNQLLQIK